MSSPDGRSLAIPTVQPQRFSVFHAVADAFREILPADRAPFRIREAADAVGCVTFTGKPEGIFSEPVPDMARELGERYSAAFQCAEGAVAVREEIRPIEAQGEGGGVCHGKILCFRWEPFSFPVDFNIDIAE